MLSMLLLLVAAPQSVIPPMPPEAPRSAPEPRMRVFGGNPPGCAAGPIQTNDLTTRDSGLLWREGGDAVGLYRLLDRRVNGCPDPIIVNYRVPGSNAIGREATAPGRGDRTPRP